MARPLYELPKKERVRVEEEVGNMIRTFLMDADPPSSWLSDLFERKAKRAPLADYGLDCISVTFRDPGCDQGIEMVISIKEKANDDRGENKLTLTRNLPYKAFSKTLRDRAGGYADQYCVEV